MSADAKREAAADGFASMTLEAGGRLGRYRILGLLGRGGMADVYRAEDERLGREVALKLVPPEFARDPDRVERFEREVRAAAKLTHANIVTLFEFDRAGDQPFYTMALMRGGDLKARIRSHPEGMPPEEAREIALAVARALAYAHSRGFVHRDVKPENILFDEDGTPQLTDFGIARAMSSGTRMTATGMSIGSPHYVSPEQARGQAVDGRSDLYSLGVVLYEMLTGRVPFDAADTFAVAYSHINDPVPLLPGHLADWQPLLNRLLAKSPADRYGSAGELADVLVTAALPQVSETRAGDVLERPLAPLGTRVISRAREVGSTAGAKEFVPGGAAEVGSPRRGLLAVAAGGVLALAVVAILYVAQRGPEGLEHVAADDRGGGATPVRASRSTPANPASVVGGSALLVVETTPSGTEVLVDGIPVGTTPLERSDLRAGLREVTLRHPHYETLRETGQRFEEGRVVRIDRVLVRGRGALTVTTTPRDAWVEVEGRRLAEGTPVTLEDLPAGEVAVRLGAARHGPLALAVEIPKGGLARLERTLERLPAVGDSLRFDGIEFVWVPAGEFRMGSTSSDANSDERPVTRVRVTRGFWLGKYEVTQAQWQGVMGSNPSRFQECGGRCPVERVSWEETQEFIGRLNGQGGREVYRLPTEAEWEYAARAGTDGDRYGNVDAIAWYDGNSGDRTHPVGGKSANAWGLHDMLGNVWEWVQDRYGEYPGGAVTDPRGPRSGSRRAYRGGSWGLGAAYVRAPNRGYHAPASRSSFLGFRLLRTTR